MLAVSYNRVGPADEVFRFGEIETPSAGAGEVRVKLASSGVNPSDVKSRAGVRNKTLAFPLIVPHSDGAGVIDQVGSGVDPARIGERVWVWNAAWQRPMGTAAAVRRASCAAGGQASRRDRLRRRCVSRHSSSDCVSRGGNDGGVNGKSVLVTGGAGAVGHYAIQFAKLGGATASDCHCEQRCERRHCDRGRCRRLHQLQDGECRSSAAWHLTGGRGIDRIIEMDLAANIQSDLAALRPDGEIVVYGSGAAEIAVPFFASILKNVRYQFFIVYNLNAKDRASDLADVSRLLSETN